MSTTFDALEAYVLAGAKAKIVDQVNAVFQPLIDIINQAGLQNSLIGGVPVLTLIEQGKSQLSAQLLPAQYKVDSSAFIAATQQVITVQAIPNAPASQ